MFVAVMPSLLRYTGEIFYLKSLACKVAESNGTFEEKAEYLFDTTSTMLRCDIHKSNYHTDLKFTDGNQKVDVKVTDASEPLSH